MHGPTLGDLLADHQLFHSAFQMDYLITARSGGTPYGCYKQALRELYKRWRGLKGLYADRELLKLEIAALERASRRWFARRLTRARRRVQLARKRLDLAEADKAVADTEREFARFHAQASELKQRLSAEHGELTAETRARLDRDMWLRHVRAMAAVDIVTTGGLRENTVTFLAACPAEMRAPVLDEVRSTLRIQHESAGRPDGGDDGPLVTWFLSQDPEVPALPPPGESPAPGPDVRALLAGPGRET